MIRRNTKLTQNFDDVPNSRGKRKYNINLPRDNPMADGGDLGYLQDYIEVLNDGGITNPDKQKFLFGVMLLTRCR